MIKAIYFLLLLVSLSSCSFSFMFLYPTKFKDSDASFQYVDRDSKDTILVTFDDHQAPVFTSNLEKEVKPDYQLESGFIQNERDSLNYYYFKSENPNDTILFFLHGNAGHLAGQHRSMIPFVKKGFNAYMIDYSGFGWSSGKAKRKQLIEDVCFAFDQMIEDSIKKNQTIIIYGQSYGGHLAVVLTSKRKKQIDALVVEGAFSSHKRVAGDYFGFLGKWFVKNGEKAEELISDIELPVLIVHSTEDEVVPYHHGEILYNNANFPKTMLTISECHICGPIYYEELITKSIHELFDLE